MSLQKRVVSASKWQVLNVGLFSLMNIVFLMIMARLVDKQFHGIFALMQIMVVILSMISKNGLYAALVRRDVNTARQVSFSFWGSVFLGSLFTMGIYLLAVPIANFYNNVFSEGLVRLISFYFVFYSFGLTSFGLMVRDMNFRSIFYAQCCSYLIGSLGIGVIMAYFDYQLWALVYSFLAFILLNSIFNFCLKPHSLALKFGIEEFYEVKNFSIGVTVTELLNSIAVLVDKLIIGKFTSMTSLALFEKGQHTSRLPGKVFGNAFDVILYSVFSKLQESKNAAKLAFERLSSLLWVIVILLSIFLYMYAHHIVVILLGANWMDTVPILKIFAISMPSLIIVKISESLFRASDKVYLTSKLKGVYVITIVLSSLLSIFYPLNLVLWLISLSYIFHLMLMIMYSCKLLRINNKDYILGLIPSLKLGVFSIVLNLCLLYLFSDHLGRLVMMVFAFIIQGVLIFSLLYFFPLILGKKNLMFISSVIKNVRINKYLSQKIYNKLKKYE